MIFSKSNLMVGHVASKSATDRGINCVRLNPDGSTVAANGKVVMAVGPVDPTRVHFPDVGEQASPGGAGVSVPLDLLEKAVKNLPKGNTNLQNVAMTRGRDPKKIQLTTTDMTHEQRIEGFPKQEPFPDWKGVFRKVRGQTGPKICLNRRDLLDLLTALEEACPDRGGENPVYLEINPEGTGLVLRCVNRESNQRAIGAITAYRTEGHWLPADKWEQGVFEIQAKKLLPISTNREP